MNKIKKLLVVVTIALIPSGLLAQTDPGCPPDCPNPDPLVYCPPQCVPIDGGLSLLIAAGLGLGAKKAYDRRKASKA